MTESDRELRALVLKFLLLGCEELGITLDEFLEWCEDHEDLDD